MIKSSIASLWPAERNIVRTGKLAAALLAILFVRTLADIATFATEPKVSGGIHVDDLVPETVFWSPLWIPMVLAAFYAYWTWPKRYDRGPIRTALGGGFAAFRIQIFSVLVSFLCPAMGALYLLLPTVSPGEIPVMLGKVILVVLGPAAFFCTYFSIPILTSGILIGAPMALCVRWARRSPAALPSEAATPAAATVNSATAWSAVSVGSLAFRLVAISIAAAIILSGVSAGGFGMFTFWGYNFFKVALPCFLVGAAIGLLTEQWAWCVAVSLPIGITLSTTHANPPGIVAQYSIEFPPVLVAVLLGFTMARKLRPQARWPDGKIRT